MGTPRRRTLDALAPALVLAVEGMSAGCDSSASTVADDLASTTIPRPDASRDAPGDPLGCSRGQVHCDGPCTNLSTDPANCGFCGGVCPGAEFCVAGTCQPVCPADHIACDGACADPATDVAHCGTCRTVCPPGNDCIVGVCSPPPHPARTNPFQVTSLGTDGCVTVDTSATGTTRSGLVVGTSGVYDTGDRTTGVFAPDTLAHTDTLGPMAALVSNLHDGTVYTLANGTQPVAMGGGTVTALVTVAGDTPGAVLPLSIPLLVGRDTGIFSGWDVAVVRTDTAAYGIDLASGIVSYLGPLSASAHSACGGWGYWGIVETAGDRFSLDYVRDRTTIVRQDLSGGTIETLAAFTDLGDACALGLSPSARRWFVHTHTASQWGAAGESLHGCPAVWTHTLVTEYTLETLPDGAAGAWIEACTAPGHSTVLMGTVDTSVAVALPFAFSFWGSVVLRQTLYVAGNGALGLSGSSGYTLFTIPTTDPSLGAFMAVDGQGFQVPATGMCVATLGTAPARRWVAEWSDVSPCCSETNPHLTFEAVLEESTGVIGFVYRTLVGVRPGTVGLSNTGGTDWLAVCNPGLPCTVREGTALRFHPTLQ